MKANKITIISERRNIMNGKRLTMHILGTLIVFATITMATSRVLSEIEQSIFSETEVLIMFGFCCVVLGTELKSYIIEYWYYKYNMVD